MHLNDKKNVEFYIGLYNLTTEALRNLYYSFMLPAPYLLFVNFGMYTWPTVVKEVYVAQKKILRTMTFKGKYDSANVLFKGLGILKFDFSRNIS